MYQATYSQFTEQGKLVAEAIVKALESNGIVATIEKTYLDFGTNWYWDTILVQTGRGDSYQALNPRQQKEINEGKFDYSEINEIVEFAKKHQ